MVKMVRERGKLSDESHSFSSYVICILTNNHKQTFNVLFEDILV